MFNKILIVCAFLIISLKVHAQYLQYEPIPYTPPPPVPEVQLQLMQQYRPLPPTQYIPPTKTINRVFLIKTAKINGNDFSQRYINSVSGVLFYNMSNSPTQYMSVAITGEKSESFGPMQALTTRDTPATTSTYGRTIMEFAWSFTNSYDKESGSASVTFIKEYRPQGTFFVCKITSPGAVTEFGGIETNQ